LLVTIAKNSFIRRVAQTSSKKKKKKKTQKMAFFETTSFTDEVVKVLHID